MSSMEQLMDCPQHLPIRKWPKEVAKQFEGGI